MESNKPFRSLAARADFLKLKDTGQIFHVNSWLLVNIKKTALGHVRCGWTIPRQVGPAVLRNRLKRWGREYLRKWAAETRGNKSFDMNLIFKRKEKGFYQSVSHKDFDGTMDKLVGKLRSYIE